MKKNRLIRDFDYYIDEYMYNCRSRKLRPKTMQSYEQTLRLFERWCAEELRIFTVDKVTEQMIRKYINDLQEHGKYTFGYIPSSYSMPLVFGTVIKETVSDGLFFIQSSSRRVLSRCNREYVTVS